MKKHLPILGGGIVLAVVTIALYLSTFKSAAEQDNAEETAAVLYYTPAELWEQEFSAKKVRREAGYAKADKPGEFARYHEGIRTREGEQAPAYPAGHRMLALDKAQAAARRAGQRAQLLDWIERGPANVPGRTRGILVLPGDSLKNTWLAGSVAGGVWKTTDGGKSWVNKTPYLPNMATSCLAMADANPNIIYAGTGESYSNYTGVAGDGIYKSTDGGESWTQLTATAKNDDFRSINRLLVNPKNPQVLLAATTPSYWGQGSSKIMKSTDGGTSWRKVYDTNIHQKGSIDVSQILAHPTDFNILYGTVEGVGVLKSTDAGENWKLAGHLQADGRIELAIAPTDPARIYASAVGSVSGVGSDLYVSDNAAESWLLIASLDGAKSYNFLGGQGWYDNTLAVNPFDKDEVYVAGVNMFRVRVGAEGTTAPAFNGVKEQNTSSFLAFVNFGADLFNGQLAKGSATESKFTNIEIRFGAGLKQKAHRFTVSSTSGTNGDGGAGVPALEHIYQDYVEVPFQVWDTDNNQQLMASFRDQERNGVFNLNDRTLSDAQMLDNREYLYIHALPYQEAPNAEVSKAGGQNHEQLYFMWPTLTAGQTWSPANLPQSQLVILWGSKIIRDGLVTVVCDAYGSFGGPNGFKQSSNATTVEGVHPDHHNLVMVPMDEAAKTFKILNANDGGVYVSNTSTEPGINEGDWTFGGNGYNTTQLYGVDKRPGADEYLFGSQDNGTWRTQAGHKANAASKYIRSLGGDGFEVIWHASDPAKMMGTIYYNAIYRSADGGKSWSAAVSGLQDNGSGTNSPFVTRLATHKSRPDIVFAVGRQGVWRTEDFGGSWSLAPISSDWSGLSFSNVEVSLANPTIVWAGSGMSSVSKLHVSTDGGKTFAATNNYAVMGSSTGIFTHPTEDATAYALFSFAKSPKIVKTNDLGKTWTDISGFAGAKESKNGFPDVAVFTFLVMPHNPDHIWVGTEIGLVESIDGGKNWMMANNGLPNVSIWDMKIVDDQVVIGTHARGIWTVTIPDIPEIIQAPLIASAVGTANGDLAVSIQLRSVYDSARVFINNKYITSFPSGGIKDTALVLDGRLYRDMELTIGATGYIRSIEYPSTPYTVEKNALPLGFEEEARAGRLAFDAYPNPAQALATLRYYLEKPGQVSVRVLDSRGRVLEVLNFGEKAAGNHTFPYALPPGADNQLLILELRTEHGSRVFKLLR